MRPTRWMAGVLAAGMLTAVPIGQADGADALAGKPAVGQCRQLSGAQVSAASNTTSPIPCAKKHDDRVIAVPALPKGVHWTALKKQSQIYSLAVHLCYSPLRQALGQDDQVRNRTAYTFLYFIPTKKQRSKGARWIRCDLALQHGRTWAELPTDKVPALADATPSANVARCLRKMKSRYLTTTCAATHSYRSTGSFVVKAKKFPGTGAILHDGRSRCPALVSTDTNFRFTWNPKVIWNRAGDHTIVCYSHATN